MSIRRLPSCFVAILAMSLVLAWSGADAEAGKGRTARVAGNKRTARPGKHTTGKVGRVGSRDKASRDKLGKDRGRRLQRRMARVLAARHKAKARKVGRRKLAPRRPEVAFRRAMDAARKRGGLIIDVGGEGAHRGAVNVNPGTLTSTTGKPGRPIPNLVRGVIEKIPFGRSSASVVIVENTPIRPGAAAELARVISSGGIIKLSHPADYGRQAHARVAERVGGQVMTNTADGISTSVIIAP